MYISFVKALERKTGKLKTLSEVATATYDQSVIGKVLKVAESFDSATKEGAVLRATYSHVQCVITNSLRFQREYADVDLEAAAKLAAEAAEVERVAREEAQRKLKAAQDALEQAKAELLASGGSLPEDELKTQLEALKAANQKLAALVPPDDPVGGSSEASVDASQEEDVAAGVVAPPPDED